MSSQTTAAGANTTSQLCYDWRMFLPAVQTGFLQVGKRRCRGIEQGHRLYMAVIISEEEVYCCRLSPARHAFSSKVERCRGRSGSTGTARSPASGFIALTSFPQSCLLWYTRLQKKIGPTLRPRHFRHDPLELLEPGTRPSGSRHRCCCSCQRRIQSGATIHSTVHSFGLILLLAAQFDSPLPRSRIVPTQWPRRGDTAGVRGSMIVVAIRRSR